MHDRNPATLPVDSLAVAKKGLIVLGLVLLALIVCWTAPESKPGGDVGVSTDLPPRLGPLESFYEPVSEMERYILPRDTIYSRATYGLPVSSRNDRILLSIVLSGQEKRSIHRPERCLLAQGWALENSTVETIKLASGHDLKVTALLVDHPVTLPNGQHFNMHAYYLYWFVGKDVTTPSHLDRLLRTNWDLLFHRINQRWAYILVSANISSDWRPDGLTKEQTLDLLKNFVRDSAPYYMISEGAPAKAL